MGQCVLQNADDAPCEQSRERIAPRRRETDRDQQRKIEDADERQPNGQERLQNQRSEWNGHRGRQTEAINLNLLSRCVGDRHVSEDHPRGQVAAWQVAAWVVPLLLQASQEPSLRQLRLPCLRMAWQKQPAASCRIPESRELPSQLPLQMRRSSALRADRRSLRLVEARLSLSWHRNQGSPARQRLVRPTCVEERQLAPPALQWAF